MMIYFCQGWTGWLFVTWMPSLLQKNYGLDLKKSSFFYAAMLFSAMIAEFLGGVATDYLLRRTGNLKIARSLLIAISWCFVLAGLLPAILVHDLAIGLAGFTVALFFLGMAIAPLWTATMDIAPDYAGSSSALMNSAGAVAGILSPVVFGWILDLTGSWTTPFVFSVGLLLFAIVMTYRIRPDRPIDAVPTVARLAVAGE
jgi:nitrate/nitrite transporter NarK